MEIHLKNPQAPTKEAFEAQKGYMDALIELGVLPNIPIHPDYDDREYQSFIRDIVGYLSEEVAEAQEQLLLLRDRAKLTDLEGAKEALIDYNEEVCDVLAFFLELFAYTGITVADLQDNANGIINNYGLSTPPLNHDLIEKLFSIGKEMFHKEVGFGEDWKISAIHLTSMFNEQDYKSNGARILGRNVEFVMGAVADCYTSLWLAMNTLKNKPWKPNDKETNVPELKARIIMAFIEYMAGLSVLEFRPAQLIRNFLHKVKINHDRLDGKSST